MVTEYGSNFELANTVGDGKQLEDTEKVIYLRSAREALFAICQIEKMKVILMPALCCASMVQPFIQAGVEVRYYKILPGLKIDFEDLKSKMVNNSALLVMHYYGIRSYNEQDLINIKNQFENVTIIQDCTQHVFTKELFDDIADYWIGSIRKWVAIADGAFLATKKNRVTGIDRESIDDGFVAKTFDAMKLKQEYLKNGNIGIKEKYRSYFGQCMAHLKQTIVIHEISSISRELFSNTVDCEQVIARRYDNFHFLRKEIEKKYPDSLKLTVEQNAPLCLNVIVNNRDAIQRKLADLGVYCQVLWPLTKEAEKTCRYSEWYSKHMLAIPCDQRYTVKDMENVSQHLVKVMECIE